MSREIKFRAWDKKAKILIMVVSLDWDKRAIGTDLDYVISKGNGDSTYPMYSMNEYELMQYTGLKDKNGKEIYEGDIFSEPRGGKKRTNGEVVFEDGCFCVNFGEQLGNYILCNRKDYKGEVIGNVYEHSALLK